MPPNSALMSVGADPPYRTIPCPKPKAPFNGETPWVSKPLTLNPITCIRDAVNTLAYHFSRGQLSYLMLVYITLAHLGAIKGLTHLADCRWQTLVFAAVLWPVSGFGITGGSHRLWAHRSYQANWVMRTVIVLLASMANQGAVYHWVRDHRVHHKFTDTDADPHNAERGFFFSHMGWLFVKKHSDVKTKGATLDFKDLDDDKVLTWQRRLDPWGSFFMCFAVPTYVAAHFWGEDPWNALWVAGFLRYTWVLHCTWLVNSAAHFFGDRPYNTTSWPAENVWVSIFAIGEGWHNWHHQYPYDYAASEFGVSSQYNPTKLIIDTLAWLGLVSGRKRATGAWELAQQSRTKQSAPAAESVKAKQL